MIEASILARVTGLSGAGWHDALLPLSALAEVGLLAAAHVIAAACITIAGLTSTDPGVRAIRAQSAAMLAISALGAAQFL